MFLFVISIIAVIAAIVWLVIADDKEGKMFAIIPAVISVFMFILSCVTIIPTGYTGILVTFGRVSDKTLDAGLAVTLPWQSVVRMDNRLQEVTYELECFSSDIQQVNVKMNIGYKINQQNAMTIYKEIGKDYMDIAISPKVRESVKNVIAHYNASSLIDSREKASAEIDQMLNEGLNEYNINLNYASIANIDFSDAFEAAVEAKTVATQQKEQANAEAEKKKIEATAKAEAEIIEAEAEASKSKISADAELYVAQQKAIANKELNSSLTGNLLDYYKITNVESRWDGKMPAYVGGSGASIPVLSGMDEYY